MHFTVKVTSAFFHRFFKEPSKVSPINTASLQCFHGCLDIDKVQDARVVSQSFVSANARSSLAYYHANVDDVDRAFQADKLHALAGEPSHRLQADALCKICVNNKRRIIKLNDRLARDLKIVNEMLKQSCDESDE